MKIHKRLKSIDLIPGGDIRIVFSHHDSTIYDPDTYISDLVPGDQTEYILTEVELLAMLEAEVEKAEARAIIGELEKGDCKDESN